MRVIVCKDYNQMSEEAAKIISSQIILKPNSVLGLATGTTPIGTYKRLIEMNKSGYLDFSKVKSFNLDEYYPIKPDNVQSYRYFMNENLFNHVNIDINNTRVPNGMAPDPVKEGADYDAQIEAAGGIDLQLLGIGRNGHIAFNEPDEALISGTHATSLTEDTIEANSRLFNSIDEVPTKALTMGMGSILKSKMIVLLANGKNKHNAFKKLLDEEITTSNPSTFLKVHPNVVLICDEECYNG
ncbi:MAG: glucosamine-6-phosphate deaminase [Ruminococcaceae bacterium]|nr:glucosamine-6-phosphate deaminase [Oscillospiraceae bacterium]